MNFREFLAFLLKFLAIVFLFGDFPSEGHLSSYYIQPQFFYDAISRCFKPRPCPLIQLFSFKVVPGTL